jgi:hypothetical protein
MVVEPAVGDGDSPSQLMTLRIVCALALSSSVRLGWYWLMGAWGAKPSGHFVEFWCNGARRVLPETHFSRAPAHWALFLGGAIHTSRPGPGQSKLDIGPHRCYNVATLWPHTEGKT